MTALHAIAVWAIIAPFWMAVVYLLALPVLREVHFRRVVVVSQTDAAPPPKHPIP